MGERLSNGGQDRVNGNLKSPEKFAEVSIRSGDLEKDIPEITRWFNQESVTPHLAGIAPVKVPGDVDIERYRRKLHRENPNLGEVYTATEEGMMDYFKQRNTSSMLLIAEVAGKAVGMAMIDLPGSGGMAVGSFGKWVVDEETRREGIKGVGYTLLKVATANMLGEPKKGGLGLTAVQAGIIQVNDWQRPLSIFTRIGYNPTGVLHDNCISWEYMKDEQGNDKGRFVFRDVMGLRLEVGGPRYEVDSSLLLNLNRKTA